MKEQSEHSVNSDFSVGIFKSMVVVVMIVLMVRGEESNLFFWGGSKFYHDYLGRLFCIMKQDSCFELCMLKDEAAIAASDHGFIY